MELAEGSVFEGKVTGITKFGAFVSFEGGKSGLVHISEIANTYVNDVNDFVQLGQAVQVKVLNINEGKINLSMKRAEEAPRRERVPREAKAPEQTIKRPPIQAAAPATGNQEFEDRLKRFMQESDSRIADNRMYSDHKQRNRRR